MVKTMRGWMLGLALVLAPLVGQAYPTITTPVTDETHSLPAADVEDLARRMVAHREATHVQMAVLVVPSTNGEPIEDYAHGTAEQWAGGQAGQDNGLLVILAVRDHRSRIEVGRGLEAQVTDGESRQLLDGARPNLRSGNLGGALRGIVDGLVRETGGTVQVASAAPAGAPRAPIRVRPPAEPASDDGEWFILGLALFGLAAVALLVWWLRRSDDRSSRYVPSTYPSYGSSNFSRTGGYTPRPAPRATPAPAPAPSPVPSGLGDALAAGAVGAAAGVAVGAAASALNRRESATRYDLGSDPKQASRVSPPVYTPPKKKPEPAKRDSGSSYASPSYESPRRRDSDPPAYTPSPSYSSGSIFGGSSRSSTPAGGSIFGGSGDSPSSTDWGGGGGGFDGGGSSGDW